MGADHRVTRLIQNQEYSDLKSKYYVIYFDIKCQIQMTNTLGTLRPPPRQKKKKKHCLSSSPSEKRDFG